MNTTGTNPEISILLPCLDEAPSVLRCLDELQSVIRQNKLNCEVIIIDNGSVDGSASLVSGRVGSFPELILTHEPVQGYGSAYLRGLSLTRGLSIVMADLDGSYDFADIPKLLSKLDEGFGLVVGNRFMNGSMEKKSMPWHHRYIGNPFLSYLVRILFKVSIRDIHCGIRAMTKKAARTIDPHATGMEFASEMVVKAAKRGVSMTEIPVAYRERLGQSKLRSFADGWRHARFLLLYSPLALFFLPGAILFGAGTIAMALLYFFSLRIFGLQLYIHPMFLSSALIIIGYQGIFFAGFARIYAVAHLGDNDRLFEKLFRYVTIERAGTVGIVMTVIGASIYAWIFARWVHSGFGSLNEIKNSVVALTFTILGIQTVFSAFMLSIVGIKER